MRCRWIPLIALVPLAAGADDALSRSCPVCHGDGRDGGSIPSLESWSAAEVERALREFRDGVRSGSAMPRLAAALTDDEIRRLARDRDTPP